MKWCRIYAITLRHLYSFRRDWSRLADAVYWPLMDLVLWGLSVKWLSQNGLGQSNVLLVMLTAIVFWQIVWRANYEVSVNLLEETWCKNTVNLFSTPLQLREWAAGVMLVGGIKVVLSAFVGLCGAWFLYTLNLLAVGHMLVPFLVGLVLFGWTLGFIASALIVGFGRNVQTLAWAMGFVFAPLSAVYYPVSTLPEWLQPFSWALPSTYVFEGMREVLGSGDFDFQMLFRCYALNVCYLVVALMFFAFMFERRRKAGLGLLES